MAIAKIIRKTTLHLANDDVRDVAYWLSRPVAERLAAVEAAVSQMLAATSSPKSADFERQLNAWVAQIHALPLDPHADPNFELEWDESGLPK